MKPEILGVRRHVLALGLKPVLIGLAVGVALAASSTGALESVLFGITPLDALTFAGASLALGACGLRACLIPAARAARIDPATTLRE